ncbi:MAG: hypothetical protein H5T90_04090 [Acetomicrobium sp.]|nr:hypothetical protein [Acetomicrobium sp.]
MNTDRDRADRKESIYVIPCDEGFFTVTYSTKREVFNCYLGVANIVAEGFYVYQETDY